jgi:hypothetical protein
MEMQMDRVRRSRWQFCGCGQFFVLFGLLYLVLVAPGLCKLTRMVAISCRMSTACWAAACFSARSVGGMVAGEILFVDVDVEVDG